ncbi:TonB family protein [Solimonas sp. SE-A11]|uniref:TonB family protein n=1 Tax=Solimonas sp. SE-A11 TaxID=3054954 RepID=UPI00259CDCE4|nr:TonB family protein [Solimonas sp. SE-A11]MDM4768738.1 TonB family protein [Solimonas sp. SE-A11]
MSTTVGLRLGDEWGITAEADRRFRAWSTGSLALVLATMLVLQSWTFVMPDAEEEPVRVTLLPPPPPPLRMKPVAEPPVSRPQPKPQAKPTPAQAAPKKAPAAPAPRELAARSGLMTMRDQLSSMRDSTPVTGPQTLVRDSATSISSRRSGETLAASAASGSSGIGSGARSVTAVQGSGSIGARRTAEVQSALGTGRADAAGAGGDAGGSRSLKELQLAFDRNKSSLFSIFNRAARESADVGAGKIVVSLTIAPDGSVTRCELVSSSFGNPDLEQKILQRVRMLNFGAKDVPPYTYANYPINFLPS